MINLEDEVRVLKAYIEIYNSNPTIDREELYKCYYGKNYKSFMAKGSLDKFIRGCN